VDLARREIVHIGVTPSPSAQYAGQCFVEAVVTVNNRHGRACATRCGPGHQARGAGAPALAADEGRICTRPHDPRASSTPTRVAACREAASLVACIPTDMLAPRSSLLAIRAPRLRSLHKLSLRGS
jgi:hypothetical protein